MASDNRILISVDHILPAKTNIATEAPPFTIIELCSSGSMEFGIQGRFSVVFSVYADEHFQLVE